MPSFLDEVLDAGSEVDALFGEDFELRPFARASANAPDKPDPTRDIVPLRGVWRTKIADPRESRAYDPREAHRPGVAGDAPHVEFSAAATTALDAFEVKDGDQILRLSNNTLYRARTATVSPNGTWTVPLNRLGLAS